MNKLIILILICCCPLLSICCSCAGKETTIEAVKNSDIVFLDSVISKSIIEVQDDIIPENLIAKKAQYKFLITEIYKGKSIQDTITITTGMGSGDCGYPFEIGLDYIVYSTYNYSHFERGKEVDKFLTTTICSKTTTNQKADLKEIKKCIRRKE